MSGKRYELLKSQNGNDWGVIDNDKYFLNENHFLSEEQVVDRLNDLCEENEQLKFENETLKSNYQREIQSSIDFCNNYSKTNGELLEKIKKLEKEKLIIMKWKYVKYAKMHITTTHSTQQHTLQNTQ